MSRIKLSPELLQGLSDYPALQPPSEVVPNFVNPENQNQPLFIATSLELGLMIIFVCN